jgi:hypothetical protein
MSFFGENIFFYLLDLFSTKIKNPAAFKAAGLKK